MKKRMKKLAEIVLALVVLCLCLTACGPKGNTLVANADVEGGALGLWKCEGETSTRGYIFDVSQRREVLDQLSKVSVTEVKDWSPAQIKEPIYGIQIWNKQGRMESALWSENLWITQEGKAYRFAYDVGKLLTSYEWQSVDTFSDGIRVPCAYALSYVNGAWDTTWMMPAKEPAATEGIQIQLLQWTEDSVMVNVSNHSQNEWTFGEYYHLEVLLDGTWYHVPQAPGNMWAVHDIAYILTPGGNKDMTYSLLPYGELPSGQYRLVAEAFDEGLAVEYEIVK